MKLLFVDFNHCPEPVKGLGISDSHGARNLYYRGIIWGLYHSNNQLMRRRHGAVEYTIMKTEFLVTKKTWPSPDHCRQVSEGEAVAEKFKLA
jgi:hypothetical protein